MQSSSAGWSRPDESGAVVGSGVVEETTVAQGIAAMAASGKYGPTRACAGIVATCHLTLGSAVGALQLSLCVYVGIC